MTRWIRRIAVMLLTGMFAFSVTYIAVTHYEYRKNDRRYEEMADRFVAASSGDDSSPGGAQGMDAGAAAAEDTLGDAAPIQVDFQGLRKINGDIIGWLYCEDTPINYPVLQGRDNDQYLRHSYDGSYDMAGCIFVESENRGLEDANTIIYGHHMKNGSMFAVLDKWADQAFYEEHPCMWLLTPNQNYRIDLFSGYTTAATSETYTIFPRGGQELEEYLALCAGQSAFQSDVELDGEARYVVLSTCAYVFDNARSVLHGKLVPVGAP